MIRINLGRLCRMYGISDGVKHLTKFGFTYLAARDLYFGKVRSLKFWHIESLCKAFNCTPNDLLEWIPADDDAKVGGSPLESLKREKDFDFGELKKMLSEYPPEKAAVILKKIKEMDTTNI